jgi:hypothetical protein
LAAALLAASAPPSKSGKLTLRGPTDHTLPLVLTPALRRLAAASEPLMLICGRWRASACALSAAAATTARAASARSGRCCSSWPGSAATAIGAGCGTLAARWASRVRSSGSGNAVSSTSVLSWVSQAACCASAWLRACEAPARASAASAGAVKPRSALKPVRREVSAREAVSLRDCSSCASQLR